MLSSHAITQLVHEYGLALVFLVPALQAVGVPLLPGGTAIIAAALYAAAHGLPITGVIAAGAAGALAGGMAGYVLGRWRGEGLLLWLGRRLRQDPVRVQSVRAEFVRRGTVWLFIGRFIGGIRNVTGLLAGASGMPLWRFVVVSAAAAIAWASLNGLGYYWFGQAVLRASTPIKVVLIVVGIAWLLVSLHLLRRRALSASRMPPGERDPVPARATAR
ncbi:MAG TPA: VTT domain-containing protein [Solirubrobacteraceae bacterium]|nr:VTT domain-containing protein [Solirubrobacteraceae bacterium]